MACCFCGDVFEKNKELGLPTEDSIIYEDSNIYVMPDICPLAVGHMLIITKQHFQGYANADTAVLHSVEKFLCCYEKKIGYRDYTIFEHGAVIPYTAGASVNHAHIHIIPFELKLHEALKRYFSKYSLRSLKELRELAQKKQPYLFCKLKSNEKGYIFQVEGMESQFLRKMAAELIQQKKSYDWRKTYVSTEAYVDFCSTLAWWKSLSYPMTFKWKKKLILEKYGLLDYKELLREVRRFRTDEWKTVVNILEKKIKENNGQYFRLILVPGKHQYKLPNYIVAKQENIVGAEEFLKRAEGFDEIWYLEGQDKPKALFRKGDEAGQYNFSGRISYSRGNSGWTELIEMVNGDDPRQLEKYSVESVEFDYLRAFRMDEDSAYTIDSIRVGVRYLNVWEWKQCFRYLERELDKYCEGLYRIRRAINEQGIYSLSLDFVMKGYQLSFLDWDTSDDDRILRGESVVNT